MTKKITLELATIQDVVALSFSNSLEGAAQMLRDHKYAAEALTPQERVTVKNIINTVADSLSAVALNKRKAVPKDSQAPMLLEIAKTQNSKGDPQNGNTSLPRR